MRRAAIAAAAVLLACPASASAVSVWVAPGQHYGPVNPPDIDGATLTYSAGMTTNRVCSNGRRAFYGQLAWRQEGMLGFFHWASRIRVRACRGTAWRTLGSIVSYRTAWRNHDSSLWSWEGRDYAREWVTRRTWWGTYRVAQTMLRRRTAGRWLTGVFGHGGWVIPEMTVELYVDDHGHYVAHFIERSEYCTGSTGSC